jgi:predicted nucleic acid-binding protein
MSHVCLDANVIIKLLLFEADSPLAESLWSACLDRAVTPVAPLILPFEILSVIRRRVHRGLLSPANADTAHTLALELPLMYVHDVKLLTRAYELATELNQPTIYDASYLAVAETFACDFWTADEAFYHAASPRLPFVHLLADFQGRTNDVVAR